MKKFLFVLFVAFFVSFVGFSASIAHAATLYYNAAVNTNWNTLGNWWDDVGFSDPAASIPVNGDTVYLDGNVFIGPDNPVSLTHVYVAHPSTGGGSWSVDLNSVSSDATFYDDSNNGGNGTLTGTVIFNDDSFNTAIIAGNTTFNNAAINGGTLNGTIVFNGTSINGGTITGNVTFNGEAYTNTSGVITGDVIFNEQSNNQGVVNGDVTHNGESVHYGDVNGNAIFNDSSVAHNTSTGISGNATFNDESNFAGSVDGNVTINSTYYNTVVPTGGVLIVSSNVWQGGEVGGTLSGSDAVSLTTFIFNGSTQNLGIMPAGSTATFNDTSENKSGPIDLATFNDSSLNDANLTGTAIFNDSSSNVRRVIGTATFNNSSVNANEVIGNATFNDTSYSDHAVTVNAVFNDQSYNSSNSEIGGNATFNDQSRNEGNVVGDATFACEAENNGTVGGTVTQESCPTPAPSEGNTSSSSGGSGFVSPAFIPNMTPPPVAPVQTSSEIQAVIQTLQEKLRELLVQVYKKDTDDYVAILVDAPDLTLGSKGEPTRVLQKFLIGEQTGYFAKALLGFGDTGYFGTYTKDALTEYQENVGIEPASGYFGPKTRAYLKTLLGN